MQLEYLEDRVSPTPRVLLMYGDLPEEFRLLREALAPLVGGEKDSRVDIASLRGFRGIDGCSLICEVGDSSLGVRPIDGTNTTFRCTLTDSGWTQVHGLLEPFAVGTQGREAHQYLTAGGSGLVDRLYVPALVAAAPLIDHRQCGSESPPGSRLAYSKQ